MLVVIEIINRHQMVILVNLLVGTRHQGWLEALLLNESTTHAKSDK